MFKIMNKTLLPEEPMKHYVKYINSQIGKTKGNDNKTSTKTPSIYRTPTHPMPLPITSLIALQNGLNSMSLFDCEKTDKNKYFRGVQINFNPKS